MGVESAAGVVVFVIFAAWFCRNARQQFLLKRKRVFALFRNVKLDHSQMSNRSKEKMSTPCFSNRFQRYTQRGVVLSTYSFDRESSPHVGIGRDWIAPLSLCQVLRIIKKQGI